MKQRRPPCQLPIKEVMIQHQEESARLAELAELHAQVAAAYSAGVEAAWEKVEALIAIPGTCRHRGKRLSKATKTSNRYLRDKILTTIDKAHLEKPDRGAYYEDPNFDQWDEIPF